MSGDRRSRCQVSGGAGGHNQWQVWAQGTDRPAAQKLEKLEHQPLDSSKMIL